ncbi:choice-of-anchor V domain-containing protein [Taibaiella koreensis]|uniref:choice-of-anchor V domain-containing protein n=1 Tax=Taibaiella koreensis TaxID=1268548 RepID=UPI000E59E219|nr:choice-of-anchor V domain-containing protein [Taibaiella koreensis]
MKRPIILTSVVLCGMYLILGSNAAGPATAGNGIRNGGPGSSGTCASCHGGGSGTTTAAITLKVKATGAAVTGSYVPGTVYTLTLTGNNPGLDFFGFQVTASKGTSQAGSFSNLGSDKHAASIGGLQVIEHSTSLAKSGGVYTVSFDWTAPAAGTGTVTFNGIINGVNHDGGTSGDKTSDVVTVNLTETPSVGIAEEGIWKNLNMSPVPASDMLNISGEGITPGSYQLTVFDLNGKALWQSTVNNQSGKLQASVPVHQLASGTYFLNIKGKSQVSRMFIKQ